MIPILYAKGETVFTNNGIGFLSDAIKCEVTEERNGAFTLVLDYPMNGALYSNITHSAIIKALPNDSDTAQLFRIYKISKPLKGIITVNAEHISYDLAYLPLPGLQLTATNANTAMTALLSACPIAHSFTAYSDIASNKNVSILTPRNLRAGIAGETGSMLDTFGGELKFNNFAVNLYASRGTNNGVVIEYGKNLKDLKQEQNIASTYTHVFPYAKKTTQTVNADGEVTETSDEIIMLTERVLSIANAEALGHTKVCNVDLTSNFADDETINETNLRSHANDYIASASLGTPAVNLTVSFVQLWQSAEYKTLELLEKVKLCDTVTVRFAALGVSASAKVIKTVFDVLLEKYKKIELGSVKTGLADRIVSQSADIAELTDTVRKDRQAAEANLSNAILEATAAITGNSGGYVVLSPKNNPQEILIMNAPTKAAATKVWRWNASGLGYSSTGYDGTYGTAITMDGAIVADYITTGTLDAIDITACSIKSGYLGNGTSGFVINSDYFAFGGKTSYADTTKDGVYIGTDGIGLGKGKFYVTAAGALTATSASISGEITATSGYIGSNTSGFVIAATALYNGVTAMDDYVNNGIYLGTDGIRLTDGSYSIALETGLLKIWSPVIYSGLHRYIPLFQFYYNGATKYIVVDYYNGEQWKIYVSDTLTPSGDIGGSGGSGGGSVLV